MPYNYLVICKRTATPPDVVGVKQYVGEKGGTVVADYPFINGFKVSFDEDALATLEGHDFVESVEKDQEA